MATDLDVVKTIFDRPSLKILQHGECGTEFESTVVLAALEDTIPNMSLPEIDGSTMYSPGAHPHSAVGLLPQSATNRP